MNAMGQKQGYDAGVLVTLACDITARPAEAPHFDDVAAAVRAVRRTDGAIVVEYDPAAAAQVAAVVAAERECCPEIGWHLERLERLERLEGPATTDGTAPLRLRIVSTEEQLDAIQSLFDAPTGGAAPEPAPPV